MPQISRRARMDIPAQVLLELASDPDNYKKMLKEIDKRMKDAHEAEESARVQRDALKEEAAAHDAKVQADNAALGEREQAVVRRESGADTIAANNAARSEELDGREALVRAREDNVAVREKEAAGFDARRDAANRELDERTVALEQREAALRERAQTLTDKENRLAIKAREFVQAVS